MKIIFTGLPYFSKKLVEELKVYDKLNTYYFFNTYYSKLDQLRFLIHILNADLIVSFNGVTSKSKSLDWAMFCKKNILMQWHGTDVIDAIKRKKDNDYTSKYIDYSTSYTDAEWLKKELKSIDIEAELLHFKHFNIQNENKESFRTLNTLTYIGQDKEEFYGLQYIKELAIKFPQYNFNIVGSNGKNDENILENIQYHGWVDKKKMNELRNECPIFIRLTLHDGYSLSILEALANGNHVIWNYPHPKVNYASNINKIISTFNNCINKVKLDAKPVEENIEWIKQNANQNIILDKLVETFLYVARK